MNMKIKYQKGMTLMELLVAGTISIIVSSGMVILMASTLGTGTQTIKMTQLSKEMRSAMQIMTRELRRANYHSSYTSCFGRQDCLEFEGIESRVEEINIAGECFWFWYDRPQRSTDPQKLIPIETVAAFRRTVIDGVGIIQMFTGGTGEYDACPANVGDDIWVDITNSELVDVLEFVVSNAEPDFASYAIPLLNPLQRVERIAIKMEGRLRDHASLPAWMQGGSAPSLTLKDFIRVRNDVYRP